MDTCTICGGNTVISKCTTCLIKYCPGCLERHKGSCNILKKDKYQQCQYHFELVKAYCCNCYELICKKCVVDNHLKHDTISLSDAHHNSEAIATELSLKQTTVHSYIDACNDTRQKYCFLQAQIEEEEKHFQRCISFVKESLMQEVETNIKKIEDQCRAGDDILKLQEIPPENARQNQKFPLIYLEQLSRYRNRLNAFEKQYMGFDILAHLKITQSREDVHRMFRSKVVAAANNCDNFNAQSYEAMDNKMDIDPIVQGGHTQTIRERPDATDDGQMTPSNSDGYAMTKWEEESTELRRTEDRLKQEQQKQLYMEQQCPQEKTNVKELETEYDQLKQENKKLQHQKQQDAEQNHQLCKEKKDLQERLTTAGENQKKVTDLENEVHGLKATVEKKEHAIKALTEEKNDCLNRLTTAGENQKKVTDLENEVHGLKVTVEKKEHAIKALTEEKNDCLNRLSSMAGDKLTKGNPAITDLGDPNRPMKIAEKYGGLYDNEWTDAMESSDDAMRTHFSAVDHQQFDEILVYHLHRLVMCCYRECLKLSTAQEQTIRSAIINSMKLQIDEDGTDVNNMPGYREIVNLRRQNAQQFANTLFQNKMISMTTITTDWDYIYKKEELIGQLLETPFFEKCVHLCWYMVIQDPVMYMTEEIKPDTVFDRDVYKEFMQSGDKVKYVVWPALFLHEGGPLLYKGVVQAYK